MVPQVAREALRETFGWHFYARRSYSQEGEDLILMRMFDGQPTGVYVDVGAHHPYRFSNTCLLHKRGWRGINIDARPGSMASFRRFRPSDINLEIGISEQTASLEFYSFVEPALNTFDRRLAESRQSQGWSLESRLAVPCARLADVLSCELPRLGTVALDVLSIDVEGLDLQVLRSNDWQRFRPKAVAVEMLEQPDADRQSSAIQLFLDGMGYRLFCKLYNSAIFVPAD
jgi:FkbM family methyltransferase